jgi:hypothetical protein
MIETTVGREPVQIVEIRQPFCANVFGIAPCTATGTADRKCYNTRATCRDTPNFALGTPLSLFFASGRVAEMEIDGAPYIIPSLVSVSTTPTRINVAGSNADASGFGNRAVCSLVFNDHAHSDFRVDPYVAGRSWNPLSADRGSFWTRWMVRNKYRQNVVIIVYEGYAGQALSAMVKRTYFMQSISGPSGGRVSIQGKDILTRLEERKAQAPAQSPGKLFAAITNIATSFEVTNAALGDYPAPGTVRIGDEIMTYSAVTTSTNGVTLTISARGTDNSVAAAHALNETVQWCWRIINQPIDAVFQDLLETYGQIPATYLNLAGWATEVGTYRSAYLLNALISIPTPVIQLGDELQEQTLVNLWWNERTALVDLRAIRGIDAEPPLLTAEDHICADSFALSENPDGRASRVWISYNRRDHVKSATDLSAYAEVFIDANLESESDNLYGEPAIRKIYARWLSSGALANTTASRIITRFVDVPSVCQFRLDAKDRTLWVGDLVRISHYLDVDEFGSRRLRIWQIISAEETLPGEMVEYEAADATLYGRINYVMAAGVPNYPGAALAPFKNAYIGNAAGLLSDGANSARIT